MRSMSRAVRGAFWVLMAAVVFSAPAIPNAQFLEAENHATGCEPAGLIDLSARILSTTEHGSATRVLVEITLFSRVPLPAATLHHALVDLDGGHGAILFQKDLGDLPRYLARKLQHKLELDTGVRHSLAFTVQADGNDGALLETTTYLSVNLDPEKQPRNLGDVMQYRARRVTP